MRAQKKTKKTILEETLGGPVLPTQALPRVSSRIGFCGFFGALTQVLLFWIGKIVFLIPSHSFWP